MLVLAGAPSPSALMPRGSTLSTSSDRCEVTTPDGQRLAAITRHAWGRGGWFSDRTYTIWIGEVDPPALRILVLAD